MRRRFGIAAAMVVAGLAVSTAESHEFWIDGQVVEQDGEAVLSLDLKVGQTLDGVSLPYVPEKTASFEWVQGGTGDISGVTGAIPAARVPLDRGKATVIFHRTIPRRLVHQDWVKFLDYIEMEGLDGIEAAHAQRGLPRTGFTETYTRHAKLVLVAPESQKAEDRYLGSPLEIVLDELETGDPSLVIRGRVLGEGRPIARQISLFYGTADGTRTERLRTGPDGSFAISVPRSASILLNTVRMSPPDSRDAAWHSDWASTFVKLR